MTAVTGMSVSSVCAVALPSLVVLDTEAIDSPPQLLRCSTLGYNVNDRQGGSNDSGQDSNTERMACGGTLYASRGWDRYSLFIDQNGHSGYPTWVSVKLVDFRRSDYPVAVDGGTWKLAGKGGTN